MKTLLNVTKLFNVALLSRFVHRFIIFYNDVPETLQIEVSYFSIILNMFKRIFNYNITRLKHVLI